MKRLKNILQVFLVSFFVIGLAIWYKLDKTSSLDTKRFPFWMTLFIKVNFVKRYLKYNLLTSLTLVCALFTINVSCKLLCAQYFNPIIVWIQDKRDTFHLTWNIKLITAAIYLFKFNNGNTRKFCEIYSKLTIKTPERS